MQKVNQIMLLRDAEIAPTEDVIQEALGKEMFDVYCTLIKIISDEFALSYLWHYYNDGKAWLCKVMINKKTVFWLSVWEKNIKASFYFTQKTSPAIFDLPIYNITKERFNHSKPIGKLIPFIFDIENAEQLNELRIIINYKKSLK